MVMRGVHGVVLALFVVICSFDDLGSDINRTVLSLRICQGERHHRRRNGPG